MHMSQAKKANERIKCSSYCACSADFKIRAHGECFLKLSAVTTFSQSKRAAMSASDYIETAYRDVRIFMQLTQFCDFIRHFEDVGALINNLMF